MFWMMMAAYGGTFEVLEGNRPIRDLHVAVHTRRATLDRCFASAPGPAKFHLTVGPDGMVSNAKYSMSASTDQAMLQCLYSEALQFRLLPNRDAAPTTFVWQPTRANIQEEPEPDAPDVGKARVTGSHSTESVQAALDRSKAQFTYCVRKGRTMHLPVPPVVTAQFKISGQGKVSDVTLANAPVQNAFTECVVSRFEQIGFEPSADGTPSDVLFLAPFGD